MPTTPHHASIFTGCLLGRALGDARGLPYEGLSHRTMQARFALRAQAKHFHFLIEWPTSLKKIKQLALLLRNIVFLWVVLTHGFIRLWPRF